MIQPLSERCICVLGARFTVADDKPTFWDRVEAGAWEPGTLAALDRLVGPGTTLLDIGAWVGPVSLYAAARGAGVIAFEPDPAALAGLAANLAANPDLAGRIRVIEGALSAEAGSVRLGARRKPGDSMSSVLLGLSPTWWEARAVTPGELDGIVGPAADLVVKIDIEGGEYGLLPALAPFLDRRRPAVLLSLHPAILRESGGGDVEGATRAALAGFAGWRAYALDSAGPGERAIDEVLGGRDPCAGWLFLPPGRSLHPA